MDNTTSITVETIINVPVEVVWQYWTDPEHITQWNYASDEWHSPYALNNLNVGGKFLYRMEAKDGRFGFDFSGSYTVVVSNEQIKYTLDDGRKVQINFLSQEDATKITEIFEAETENAIEMQKDGWQSILDNFKKYVEAN